MLIDFRADPRLALDWIVLGADGLPIAGVIRADDDAGVYIRLIPAARGGWQHRCGELATETIHAAISIVHRLVPLRVI